MKLTYIREMLRGWSVRRVAAYVVLFAGVFAAIIYLLMRNSD